jgi:DNA-binding response OmpR family regulator
VVRAKQLKLIWFDPLLSDDESEGSQSLVQAVRYHLENYGLAFAHCADMDSVYQEAMVSIAASKMQDVRALVLLNADFAQNCAVAHYLRAVAPGVCLVARTPDYKEQTLMHALQSGVDAYFSGTVSPYFLSTLLFSRMRAAGLALPSLTQAEARPMPDYGWCFAEQAWAIVSPDGKRVRLTSSERGFILTIVQQPDMSASHDVLIDHLWPDTKEAKEGGRERMSVMMSRLRQKFKRKGLELPIRTLHGSGYMFYGPFLDQRYS